MLVPPYETPRPPVFPHWKNPRYATDLTTCLLRTWAPVPCLGIARWQASGRLRNWGGHLSCWLPKFHCLPVIVVCNAPGPCVCKLTPTPKKGKKRKELCLDMHELYLHVLVCDCIWDLFILGRHTFFARFAQITNPCPNPRQPWKSRRVCVCGGGGGGGVLLHFFARAPEIVFFYPSIRVGGASTSYIGQNIMQSKKKVLPKFWPKFWPKFYLNFAQILPKFAGISAKFDVHWQNLGGHRAPPPSLICLLMHNVR